MKSKKLTFVLIAAFALLCVAGTKLSRMTRTRTIDSNSRFYTVTQDASGRFYSRYITAPDLATNLSQWATNGGPGGAATNALATLKTNGVDVTTAITSLNILYGTNIVGRTTNTAGVVDMRLSAETDAATLADLADIRTRALTNLNDSLLSNNHPVAVTFNANLTVTGKTTNNNDLAVRRLITIVGTNANGSLVINSHSNNSSSILLQRYNDIESAPTAVQSGDFLGRIEWLGYGTSNLREAVDLRAEAIANFSSTEASARLNFRFGNNSASARLAYSMDAYNATNNAHLNLNSNLNMSLATAQTFGMFDGNKNLVGTVPTNSFVTHAQAVTLSNAVVTLTSNNVQVAAGSSISVSSAGSGGVQTFTVASTALVTNVASASASNATSKPILLGVANRTATLMGIEAGANVTVTPNGSNYVIAASGTGAGSMNTVKADGVQVGGADIVTLDFSTMFSVTETPDTEINITLATGAITANELGADSVSASELNATGVEAELEAVLDLEDLQGAISTRSKLPSAIAYEDEANTYSGVQQFDDTTTFNDTATLNAFSIFNQKVTLNRDITIPWEHAVASAGIIYATNGPRQLFVLAVNTNLTFAPLSSGDASNSVSVLVTMTQSSAGGFRPTFMGQTLVVNTNAGRRTDVFFFVENGVTNAVAIPQMDLNAPTAGQVIAFHDSGVLTNKTAGSGDALTSNPLSQFAATTSAQLRGVLSDESGTGAAIFADGAIGAATATTPSQNDNDTSVATTAFVLNQFTRTATTVTGAGSGSTNYLLTLSTNSLNDFHLGSSNVHIYTVAGGTAGQPIYWNAYITNLSANTWGINFSSGTNRWRFSGVYGTNAPTVLTNDTMLQLSGRSDGTNTIVGYTYYKPGL